MRRVSFNLPVGLKDQGLRQELAGRVSGENQQALQRILQLHPSSHPDIPLADLEVIRSDPVREMAVVVSRRIGSDDLGQLSISNDYLLCGVNDEGFYFMHELQRYIPFQRPMQSFSFEELLRWVNRADEGFSKRIQGDILLQHLIPESGSNQGNILRMTLTTMRTVWFNDSPSTSASLGNHRLTYVPLDDQTLRQGIFIVSEYVAVVGQALILQHPEHGIVKEEIPSGHVALLAGQRGRTTGLVEGRMQQFD